MEAMELHDDLFMKIFWDEHTRIIGIDWKDATSSMTDEDFKAELTLSRRAASRRRRPTRFLSKLRVSAIARGPGCKVGACRIFPHGIARRE